MSEAYVQTILAIEELRRREAKKAALRWQPYASQALAVQSYARYSCLLGGNQSGKSHTAAHKVTYDATGIYPDWWEGPRTKRGIDIWVVGEKFTTTRDSCQKKLFGENIDKPGEGGLINPDQIIGKPSRQSGVTGMMDQIRVKHISGHTSTITFKTYEQGREALASWTGDLIWVDEEPPQDCFEELCMRLIARKGQMIITFTPLRGKTKLYKMMTEAAEGSSVETHFLGWEQAKHLDEETKRQIAELFKSNPGQLKARMTGRAAIATGLIYPFDQDDIICPTFKLEPYWPRLAGLDVGWVHPTGAVGCAWDRDANVKYLYCEYRKSKYTAKDNYDNIRKWGDIDYACDPAALQGDKGSGEKLMESYLDLFQPDWRSTPEYEHRVFKAKNGREAGIDKVYHEFDKGRLFIMDSCVDLIEEIGEYRYNDKGEIHKFKDDLMDPMRYLMMHPERFRVPGRQRYSQTANTIPEWKPSCVGRGF